MSEGVGAAVKACSPWRAATAIWRRDLKARHVARTEVTSLTIFDGAADRCVNRGDSA